jgi:hypothetical protein
MRPACKALVTTKIFYSVSSLRHMFGKIFSVEVFEGLLEEDEIE